MDKFNGCPDNFRVYLKQRKKGAYYEIFRIENNYSGEIYKISNNEKQYYRRNDWLIDGRKYNKRNHIVHCCFLWN